MFYVLNISQNKRR